MRNTSPQPRDKAGHELGALALAMALGLVVGLVQLAGLWSGLEVDNIDQTFHLGPLQAAFFRSGEPWYTGCLNGLSLLANPTYALFSVINAPHAALAPGWAYRVTYLAHYPLFGAALWFWVRGLRWSARATPWVAAAFLASGFVLSMAYRVAVHFYPYAWIALAAGAAVRFWRGEPWHWAGLAGVFAGTAVLSGDVTALLWLALACVASAWAVRDEPARADRTASRRAWGIGAATGAFLAVAAYPLAHAWSMRALSDRAAGLPLAMATAYSFHPYRWLELAVDVFGRPGTPGFTGQAYVSSLAGEAWWYPSVYMGPLAALALAAAWALAWRRKDTRLFAALATILAFLAMGRWNPGALALYEAWPPLRWFRYPAKLMLPALFLLLPAVARFAADLIPRGRKALPVPERLRAPVAALLVLGPALAQPTPFRYLSPQDLARPAVLTDWPPPGADVRVWNDTLHASSVADRMTRKLLYAGPRLWGIPQYACMDATENEWHYAVSAGHVFDPRARAKLGITHALVPWPLPPEAQTAVTEGTAALVRDDVGHGVALLALSAPAGAWAPRTTWRFAPFAADEPAPFWLDRVLTDPGATVHPAFSLDARGWLVRDQALTGESRADESCSPHVKGRAQATAGDARTQSPCPFLLTFNRRFVPGWRATVDGQPAPLRWVDGLMVGILVPAGRHDVFIRFAPWGYGLAVSLSYAWQGLAVAACAAALARRAWRARRNTGTVTCETR